LRFGLRDDERASAADPWNARRGRTLVSACSAQTGDV